MATGYIIHKKGSGIRGFISEKINPREILKKWGRGYEMPKMRKK
jgi:molybdate-binding protein